VTAETVVKLIKGEFQGVKYYIIDCRFSYEFDGGHILGAQSIFSPEELRTMFFQKAPSNDNLVIIFHCEYSSKRAPERLDLGLLKKLQVFIFLENLRNLQVSGAINRPG